MALVTPLNILSAVLVLDASLESWPMLDPPLAERRQYRIWSIEVSWLAIGR
ncbi:MAG TPA: hypothetical protein VM686_32780 [Polyangiaceae bacterium]|nr:hypothetical protein [Polyangiaceae bacterium]